MANPAKTLAQGAVHISKRIVLSYILDWILIIGIAAIGAGFNNLKNSNKRPFNLNDPSISYPLKPDTVTPRDLVLIALLAPAVITFLVSLLCVPGPTAGKSTSPALIWRRKLWEWNTAWMGLGLALASAFMITEGLKDLAGKPRPHAIAACNPDLSADSIARNRVGGLGTSFDTTGASPILVAVTICQLTDAKALRDAFASWPSGHSSFSFAGLFYLSLFLCAKFAVHVPYIAPSASKSDVVNTYDFDTSLRSTRPKSPATEDKNATSQIPPRNSAAAAPVYLLILAVFVPVGTALFVCVSRWFDFHHHGIDIFTGALIGLFTSWFSFRFYHMPIRSGSGWSWGARSRGRAFWVGVGRDGYVGDEGWMHPSSNVDESGASSGSGRAFANGSEDLEAAHGKSQSSVMGPGLHDQGDQHSAQTGLGQQTRGAQQTI